MSFLRIFFTLVFGLWFVSAISAGETTWYDSSRSRAVPVKIYFPRQAEEPAPVILFSHGLGSSIEACEYLAKAWTSCGFVCVLVQHPGCDENIWKGKVRILNELKKAYEQNWSS